jgi:hypothetical protein
VVDIYRTVEPTPGTPQNHRKTRRSRTPQETPTPDPKAQQSARLCSLLCCRRSHFAPSWAAAAPILLPLALPPLPFCSLFCSLLCRRRSHFAPFFAPSCAAAAPILLPLLLPLELPPLPKPRQACLSPRAPCCSVRAAAARLPCALFRRLRVVFRPTTDGLGVGGICRTIRQTTTIAAQTVLVRTMLGMMARGSELLWRG